MADTELELPPGQKLAESMDSVKLGPGSFTVYGAMPHMHTLGRTLRVDVEADGASRCLVNVDRWDFHWQKGMVVRRAASDRQAELGVHSLRLRHPQ